MKESCPFSGLSTPFVVLSVARFAIAVLCGHTKCETHGPQQPPRMSTSTKGTKARVCSTHLTTHTRPAKCYNSRALDLRNVLTAFTSMAAAIARICSPFSFALSRSVIAYLYLYVMKEGVFDKMM